jgi:hypothetical protein
MAVPGAPTGAHAELGKDPTTATVSWDPDPAAQSAEVVVTPGTIHYSADLTAGAAPNFTIADLAAATVYKFELVNTDTDGRSLTTTVSLATPAGSASNWWFVASSLFLGAILAMAAICGAGAIWWSHGSHRQAWYSAALALVVLGIALLLPAFANGRPFGIWQVLLGKDRRISTSKVQIFLWTLLVEFMLVYFTSRTWFGHVPNLFAGIVPGGDNSGTGSAWPDYIVLLGGPFAALVVAKTAVTTKVNNGTLQKTPADDAGASPLQVVTNDAGAPDLVDTQYFLFNLAALTFVIVGIATTNALPQIPGLLLALTGTSAAAYAANKVATQNKPTISGVTPLSVQPGQTVTIDGTNFRPPGTTTSPAVKIGNAAAIMEANPTDSTIVAIVPVGTPAGTSSVIVTSAAGFDSDAQTIQINADSAVIRSIAPAFAATGTTINVDGTGFYSALDNAMTATVTINDTSGAQLVPPQSLPITRMANGLDRVCPSLNGVPAGSQVMIGVVTYRGILAAATAYKLAA